MQTYQLLVRHLLQTSKDHNGQLSETQLVYWVIYKMYISLKKQVGCFKGRVVALVATWFIRGFWY